MIQKGEPGISSYWRPFTLLSDSDNEKLEKNNVKNYWKWIVENTCFQTNLYNYCNMVGNGIILNNRLLKAFYHSLVRHEILMY